MAAMPALNFSIAVMAFGVGILLAKKDRLGPSFGMFFVAGFNVFVALSYLK